MEDKTLESIADAPVPPKHTVLNLWSPVVAALWSVPFTPVFGAWINCRNWNRLGRADLAARSKLWSLALFAAVTLGAGTFVVLPLTHPAQAYLHYFPEALLAAWYLLSGRRQVQYVKTNVGGLYNRAAWAGPLLLAVAAYAGWIAMILLFAAMVTELRK